MNDFIYFPDFLPIGVIDDAITNEREIMDVDYETVSSVRNE